MRALFFGTPEIAVGALEALHEIATVVGVVCQPDKPSGRGLEVKPVPVKARALELGLPVTQPTKVKTPDFAAWVRAQEADVALVMAYGRILPKGVLDAPRRGCMNLHASLLPKYRGAAPITWAIVDGEGTTGVALMQMDEGMDTGDVYAMREVPSGPDTTAAELAVALSACARVVVKEDLPRAVAGELVARAQDHARATHARMLVKDDGRVDWSKPAARVHDHVRGMTPWPGAFSTLNGKRILILSTRRVDGSSLASGAGGPAGGEPGQVVVAEKDRVEIACGEGRIAILRAQLEGKKALDARDLVAGRTLSVGARLGAP
ncbi:MAG: methionyl-tRNA formyltransferase [Polyangiaceae bacterium]